MAGINFSINITRSRWLLAYLATVHGVMLVTITSLLALSWWSMLVAICIGASFIYYCQRYQWIKGKNSIVKIARNANEQWSLHYGDNRQYLKLNLIRSFVSTQLVILYFKESHIRTNYAVSIFADAVDAELFRQLRVYCRDPKTFQK